MTQQPTNRDNQDTKKEAVQSQTNRPGHDAKNDPNAQNKHDDKHHDNRPAHDAKNDPNAQNKHDDKHHDNQPKHQDNAALKPQNQQTQKPTNPDDADKKKPTNFPR